MHKLVGVRVGEWWSGWEGGQEGVHEKGRAKVLTRVHGWEGGRVGGRVRRGLLGGDPVQGRGGRRDASPRETPRPWRRTPPVTMSGIRTKTDTRPGSH